jgi:hypothetical protein
MNSDLDSEPIAGLHLSDFRLDRLLARELDGTAERDASLAHLAACAACADRYGAFERQTTAFAGEAARRRLADGIVRRAGSERRRRWSWLGGLGLAATACGVLLLARAQPSDGLRAKGSLGLEVWVARHGSGAAESLLPGAAVSPGDALRFRASTPADGHVAVASIDAAGAVSLYVPAAAGRLPAIRRGATLLDGAVELDQTLGRERLVALICPAPLETSRVVAALEAALRAARGDAAALDVDRTGLGCSHASFWLRKVPPR